MLNVRFKTFVERGLNALNRGTNRGTALDNLQLSWSLAAPNSTPDYSRPAQLQQNAGTYTLHLSRRLIAFAQSDKRVVVIAKSSIGTQSATIVRQWCMVADSEHAFTSQLEPDLNQTNQPGCEHILATFMMQAPNSHRFASSALLLRHACAFVTFCSNFCSQTRGTQSWAGQTHLG
jgi:hypothetical protein